MSQKFYQQSQNQTKTTSQRCQDVEKWDVQETDEHSGSVKCRQYTGHKDSHKVLKEPCTMHKQDHCHVSTMAATGYLLLQTIKPGTAQQGLRFKTFCQKRCAASACILQSLELLQNVPTSNVYHMGRKIKQWQKCRIRHQERGGVTVIITYVTCLTFKHCILSSDCIYSLM
jgi:hypothetical protein